MNACGKPCAYCNIKVWETEYWNAERNEFYCDAECSLNRHQNIIIDKDRVEQLVFNDELERIGENNE